MNLPTAHYLLYLYVEIFKFNGFGTFFFILRRIGTLQFKFHYFYKFMSLIRPPPPSSCFLFLYCTINKDCLD